jgi:hypothetical protein
MVGLNEGFGEYGAAFIMAHCSNSYNSFCSHLILRAVCILSAGDADGFAV